MVIDPQPSRSSVDFEIAKARVAANVCVGCGKIIADESFVTVVGALKLETKALDFRFHVKCSN